MRARRAAWLRGLAAHARFRGATRSSPSLSLLHSRLSTLPPPDVSAKFPVPLTPAGWAFSIWGLIFVLEGWGAAYQLMDAGYDADGVKASACCALCLLVVCVHGACGAVRRAAARACMAGAAAPRSPRRPHAARPTRPSPARSPRFDQARFVNATAPNWIAAWTAACLWQLAFVQQTPGGMWLALALILTACLAMGRAQLQLYRCAAACCVC